MDSNPKICVIGAGPCGLAAAKNLIQQGLTRVSVFEKNARLGGNWFFDEQNTHSSVYETTHIISSRRLSEYEDFPMPPDYSDYPSHQQILKYFEQYAEHFGLNSFIRFNTCIEQVTRHQEQQWRVVYCNETGQHEEVFDYLLVANGHHWDPFVPDYPGTFNGDIHHAHQYKKAEVYKNRRVLVVGGGNSACDVAVEISRVASKTCISMRRGQHIFPKFIFGKPTDIAFAKINWMPVWCRQMLASLVIRIIQGRYAKYQLKKPDEKPLQIHPTINSELLYFIRHGKIAPHDGIERFEGDVVRFSDGRTETFDTIIYATGYKISFPFFKQDFLDFSNLNHIPLYRKMIHPELETLFFIGLFQPQGCIWPLADYQARIAAGIIAGKLPRPTGLPEKIRKEIQVSHKRYKANVRHALEVDYAMFRHQLLDELSQL